VARESTKGIEVNRTLFRGATAGLMSGAVLTVGAVATAAIADGAAKAPSAWASLQAPQNVARELPAHTPIRPPAVRPRPLHKAASRQHVRHTLVGTPRTVAHALVLRRGWSEAQFGCLDRLWTRESNWRVTARNPSGAYGIPQALPASKMAVMGSDWRTNAITQIRWGLYYIASAYGTPCEALDHSYAYNYY
jgi:hypothetical protein